MKQLKTTFQKSDMASELSKNYTAIFTRPEENQAGPVTGNYSSIMNYSRFIGRLEIPSSKQEQTEGWGTKTVERLAKDLRVEFQDMKGLSPRNLRYMRDFALAYPQFTILQQGIAKSKPMKTSTPQFCNGALQNYPEDITAPCLTS